MPDEIYEYMCYVRNLKFEDKPDYKLAKNFFIEISKRFYFEIDNDWDWSKKNDSLINNDTVERIILDENNKPSPIKPKNFLRKNNTQSVTINVYDNEKKSNSIQHLQHQCSSFMRTSNFLLRPPNSQDLNVTNRNSQKSHSIFSAASSLRIQCNNEDFNTENLGLYF